MKIGYVILIFLFGYLLGSIPTGYLVGKSRGIDLRSVGSGNIGATNVYRALGRTAAILVFLVDGLKGFIAAKAIPSLFVTHSCSAGMDPGWYELIGAGGAVIGHSYTCWLKFRGGKGVATGAGAFLALSPKGMLIAALVWIGTFALTRIVSVASLASVAVLIAVVLTLPHSESIRVAALFIGLLVIVRHKSNIYRLLQGKELTFKHEDRVSKKQ